MTSDGHPPAEALRRRDVLGHGAPFPPGSRSAALGWFGRMFPDLSAFRPDDLSLLALAKLMEDPQSTSRKPGDSAIPAGYTYVGQFIDPDTISDRTSTLDVHSDPETLPNFRTPCLDLDSLYGGGPGGAPAIYAKDGYTLLINTRDGVVDLPRVAATGLAMIPEARNDENRIISQLHLAMMRFHNRVAGEVRDALPDGTSGAEVFARAARVVRWHYQWMVLCDFLPRIVDMGTLKDILAMDTREICVVDGEQGTLDVCQTTPPAWRAELAFGVCSHRRFFQWSGSPFIPVEFSVAAYRFGHSMIRGSYTTGDENASEVDILRALLGFQPLDAGSVIDWRRFFCLNSSLAPQPSRQIDTTLVLALHELPESVLPLAAFVARAISSADVARAVLARLVEVAADLSDVQRHSLAWRDLKRGVVLGLPTGQAVARRMGLPPALIVSPKHMLDSDTVDVGFGLDPVDISLFRTHTPLWYYILREAQVFNAGRMLGPVGGRIVAEVLIGLLEADPDSFLRVHPLWSPRPGRFEARLGTPGEYGSAWWHDGSGAEEVPVFGMPELLRFAQMRIGGE